MTRRKQIKIKIISLQKQITIHVEKIKDELFKERPNSERIDHWTKEIINFRDQIDACERMLGKKQGRMDDEE